MRRSTRVLALLWGAAVCLAPPATADDIDWDALPYTDIRTLQAVDANGGPAFSSGNFPIKIQGILLNNPEDMLSANPVVPMPGPFNLGAMWQVFVQTVDVNGTGDFGGSALFMGQLYGNVPPNLTFPGGVPTPDPSAHYTNEQWFEEIDRLNYSGEQLLRAGDLVEIRARGGMFFGGKFNINEMHQTDPDFDFEIVYLGSPGLPDPQQITLASIWDPVTDSVLFDPTRQSGGEFYQGSLVELLGVQLAPGSAWGSGLTATLIDLEGRTIPMRLGLDAAFDVLGAPQGLFDVTAIFNQEAPSGGPFTIGYELWSMSTDDFKFYGDSNGDQYVAGDDYVVWATNYQQSGDLSQGDFNGDGFVDGADYIVWASNFHAGFQPPQAMAGALAVAVPEPSTWLLGLVGVFALLAAARQRGSEGETCVNSDRRQSHAAYR